MKSTINTESGMLRMDMVRPCADCPFRTDTPCALSPENAETALEGLIADGGAFACHKTVVYADPANYDGGSHTERTQHCAGAMIFLEKIREPNRMMLRALAAGAFDPLGLDMSAPVVASVNEFLRGQRRARERDGQLVPCLLCVMEGGPLTAEATRMVPDRWPPGLPPLPGSLGGWVPLCAACAGRWVRASGGGDALDAVRPLDWAALDGECKAG